MVKLWELLEIRPGVTALAGGGGKTAMMLALARQLVEKGTVICCTTTRILPPPDMPLLTGGKDVPAALAVCRCICLAVPAEGGKLAAPAQPMEELARLADYVLVEADGSRGLPVKAHLAHEPVIPAAAGQTVLLIGASGFGRPVREAVHRWEQFCRLTGASPGEPVTAESVSRLLAAEAPGDKIFVNQTEAPALWTAARRLAELSPRPVYAGSLKEGNWTCLS